MIIRGYRVKSKDLNDILLEMNKVRKKIKKITDKKYNELLSKEITFLVDKISLNIIQRDPNVSIFDGAVQNVNERIKRAETFNDNSEYNFRIYINVMPYEEYTYLKVNCQNDIFLEAFKNLEEYSLSEEENANKKNAKTVIWTELHKIYKDNEPYVFNMTSEPDINKEELKFEDVSIRAEREARHTILNSLLSIISGGREIPPIRSMSYMDEAYEIFTKNDEIKKEYSEKIVQLEAILPHLLSHDFIYVIPGKSSDSESSEI